MYNRAYGSNFSGGIWNGIKNSFKQGTALTRLIYINIGVFLIIKILEVFFVLAGQRGFEQLLLPYVGVPALPERLLYTPWTIITNMFTQFGFLHLLECISLGELLGLSFTWQPTPCFPLSSLNVTSRGPSGPRHPSWPLCSPCVLTIRTTRYMCF